MTQKLKVAVQFYGHLRTFEQTAESLKENLFDLYDCDVFIHTWDELQHRTKTWYDQGQNNMAIDEKYIAKVNKLYSPKGLLIESQNIPEKDTVLQSHTIPDSVMSLTGITYLFYSQYRVNELRKQYQKENNISYDYVLVIRPDVKLLNPIEIDKFVSQQEFNGKNSSSCRFCANNVDSSSISPIGLRNNCATDILYFGSEDSINKTCDFYEKIKDNPQFLIDNFSNPEGLVYKHNKDNNVEMTLICYSVGKDWNVVRLPINSLKANKKNKKIKLIKRAVLKTILSLLPYCLVHNKVNKLKRKIKDEQN